MKVIGDFYITQGQSISAAHGSTLLKPYLFLHPMLKDFDGSAPVCLAPTDAKNSHILSSITPAERDDGLLLWFCVASHDRFRIQRHLSSAIVLNSGEWGSSVIAICRDDKPAALVFTKGNTVETAHLECGVVVRTTEQRDWI